MKESNVSLTQEACERLRDAIVSGKFDFGERLSEEQIARALGMSKAPVRAAFTDLRDMGLVSIVPQAGTYVFTPTPEEVKEMSGFRAMLEREALGNALALNPDGLVQGLSAAIIQMQHAIEAQDFRLYSRADSAYHRVILQHAGNRYLEKAYDLTATALEALRAHLQSGEGDFWQRSFAEHTQMRDLMEKGHFDDAQALLEEHILVINRSISLPSANINQRTRSRRRSDEEYASLLS
jgi:DNA-binding GntR family transcriptional regulator